MSGECIHGLEEGLCDSCYPKPVPEAAPRVTRPRATRAALRSTGPTAGAKAKPPVNVGDQRIYHITHMRNLAAIVTSGCLLADASESLTVRPPVDISSTANREERRSTVVGESYTVAQYVPFFVTPDSTVWSTMRARAADPRLSSEHRHLLASEYVVLVSTVDDAGRENAALSTGDAADHRSRIASTPAGAESELRRMRGDEDALREAEFLVWDTFPFESINLIGVANDRARDQVKEILKDSAHNPKVAVHPPWFAKAEA
ncbi:MAG: hypothetical protein JWP30_941 [Homoserinimonas sp.]|nr:hypothetical protein [Homoserinimonas sp.]